MIEGKLRQVYDFMRKKEKDVKFANRKEYLKERQIKSRKFREGLLEDVENDDTEI